MLSLLLPLLLTLLPPAQAAPCPDYVQALERAEDAIERGAAGRVQLGEAMNEFERGLRCGPIIESRSLRARFFLAAAVWTDIQRDEEGVEEALFAAWRTDPDASIDILPLHLRLKYGEATERFASEAFFILKPVPDPNSIIFVDGTAVAAIPLDAVSQTQAIETQSGMHIIQVTTSAAETNAVSSRVVSFPAGESSTIDINEDSFFSSRDGEISLPGRLRRARRGGGCGR